MDYVLKNLTDKPIRCEVLGVVIPAKGKMPRPLQMAEKNLLDTCGITYDGLLLEPVLMEAGSSGLAKDEVVEAKAEMISDKTLAPKPGAGRKLKGE